MTVLREILIDAKTGKLTSADKATIGLLLALLIIAIIFFVVIFKKVDVDKDSRFRKEISQRDSLMAEKDKYIFALRMNNDDKDKIISGINQRDSALQQIATNNNYLLKKLNEKDAQIVHRVNSPSFTKDSLRSHILTNY